MARAAASHGAAGSAGIAHKRSVPKWVVAAVISTYCVGLAAGLLMYRRISTAPLQTNSGAIATKRQQIGRLFIVGPDGCQAGAFDNAKPTFAISQMPCAEALQKIEPDGSDTRSGESRIREIGRYFRGAH